MAGPSLREVDYTRTPESIDQFLLIGICNRILPATRYDWVKVTEEYNSSLDSRRSTKGAVPVNAIINVFGFICDSRSYTTSGKLAVALLDKGVVWDIPGTKKREVPVEFQDDDEDPKSLSPKRIKKRASCDNQASDGVGSTFSRQAQRAAAKTTPIRRPATHAGQDEPAQESGPKDRVTVIKALKKRLQRAEGMIDMLGERNEKLHERNEKLHERVERLQSVIQRMKENAATGGLSTGDEYEGESGAEILEEEY